MQKTRGMIAAGHMATAQAAADILREGGNAFDAAVAALLASFVAEPCMSSAGGGAFMTACTNDGKAVVYDCFVQTPLRKKPAEQTEFFPVELDFGTAKETFYVGVGSAGAPGTIAGCFRIAADLGSLPMKVLAGPAIEMAKNGVVVDSFQYHDFCLLEPILHISKPSPVFWHGDDLIREGESLRNPEWADCLDHLVREGVQDFYRGDVAKLILDQQEKLGGHLTAEDLRNYRVHVRRPLAFPYRDRRIVTNPLPGLGGSFIAIALAMLAAEGPANYAPGSEAHVERLMQVLSRTDRIPRSPRALARALAEWYPDLASGFGHDSAKLGGTSHFSILDEDGNAVSVSTSNGEGCGHFVPGTGVMLNNMLGEMALMPDGAHSWEENVRLGSMMSPTVILDRAGRAEIVLGTGGAGRIPSMLTQVIHSVVDLGLDVRTAIHAPRMHWHEGVCNLEPGLPAKVSAPPGLRRLVPWEKQSLYFGGVHAVMRVRDGMEAEGDGRRGGVMLKVY